MTFNELYQIGETFEAFIEKDQDLNREKTLEILSGISVEEDIVQKIEKIKSPIYILAFAEIWCPDCMINVPALQKLKELSPLIDFRILPREGNEEYLNDYKLGGKAKIPTFIVMDKDFEELGSFIEHPKALRDVLNKGSEIEVVVARRKYRRGELVSETLRELLNIILKNKK